MAMFWPHVLSKKGPVSEPWIEVMLALKTDGEKHACQLINKNNKNLKIKNPVHSVQWWAVRRWYWKKNHKYVCACTMQEFLISQHVDLSWLSRVYKIITKQHFK